MSSVVAIKSRTFSSFSYSANKQVCRSWEGPQTASQPSRPGEISHTIDVTLSLWTGLVGGQESALLFSLSSNPLLSGSLVPFGSFAKFTKIHFCGSATAVQGLAVNHLLGGEKNCVVHSLFCMFILIVIIIIISNSSTSIYVVVLLNCLYLSPWVFPFVHFSAQPCWGGGKEGWASGCVVLSCQLPG